MSDQSSQAKIPVKKSDGSTVFMTMAEFQAYKNQGAASAPAVEESASGGNTPQPVANDPVLSENSSELKPKRKRKRKKKKKSPASDASEVRPVAQSAPVLDTQQNDGPKERETDEQIMGMPVGKKLEPGRVEVIGETDLPAVASSVELSNTAPVKDIFVDEAMAQEEPASEKEPEVAAPAPEPTPEPQTDPAPVEPPIMEEPPKSTWNPEDHASLLEEDVEEDTLPTPVVPASSDHDELIKKIQSEFPFPVAKDLQGRFESLVASLLKGIRESHDIEATAMKSTQEGGLGMNEDQAKMLLAVIAAAQKLASGDAPKMPQPPKPDILSGETSAPKSTPPPADPSTIPKPAIQKINFEELSSVGPKSSDASSSGSKIPLPKEEYQFTPPSAPNQSPGSKPMIKDVVAPPSAKRTMGPVDELHIFSLVDFRRLSPKPDAAKEIMKEKFQALQQESYVLFLDARDAWHESPLFVEYQTVLLSALAEAQPLLTKISADPNSLTEEEFWAIADINHFLG